MLRLRALTLSDTDAIDTVAARMRDTLIEVEGPERGAAMYSMQWLIDRVRWHLDASRVTAEVIVAEASRDSADIADRTRRSVGHSIYRLEGDGTECLISTTYVVPDARRHGVADALLREAQRWAETHRAATLATWTSAANQPLIALYTRQGFAEVARGPNDITGTMMVKLAKTLR
jgi:GNAT superfamily N-acetyltransferase